MDKPIWKEIVEDSKSFEQVLLLSSKLISIDRRYLRDSRAIDRAYEASQTFTLKDWQRLHDMGISLWYKQYSSSSSSFDLEYFANELLPGYQQIVNLLLKKSTKMIQSQDIESLRNESLESWQAFIARLAYISHVEQQSGKRQKKKFKLDADSKFAILAIVALIFGISLAIFVSLVRR
ncbi:hypothetical protein [Microcoleus anatoxicus]|uniref:Uncharacterized protein n=2 Tax=Microcoleus TaxID=44471 RepID=A0ABU8YVK4_9CYAN|nr:MAG: hypothetical protein EAZ96_07680 [Oscillatoriales cyanobacterium]